MQEVLEKNTRIGTKPQMVRLGPMEGDPKGYWALRAIATPLLSEAKGGIDVEVRLPRHTVYRGSRLHKRAFMCALRCTGGFEGQGGKA